MPSSSGSVSAHLRLHADLLHQLAAGEQVEELVGAAELDIGLDRHRVVRLRHGIEELVQRDGLLRRVALGEVVALEDAGDGELARELEQVCEVELAEPLGVAAQLGLVGIEDLERLLDVGLRVRVDLLARERRAGRVAAGRVADERREVADDEDDGVPEVLELAQLAQRHRMTEVQVGRGRVDAELDAQRDARARASCAMSAAGTRSAMPLLMT